MQLGKLSNRLTRCIGGIALAALVVVACREATAPTSLNLLVVRADDSLPPPDYWWVVVKGVKPITEIMDTIGVPRQTIVFNGLEPGDYRVMLVGFDSVADQSGRVDRVFHQDRCK